MEKLEIIVLTEIWSDILERINKTSLSLQKNTLTMDVATKLFASLANFIDNVRNNFDHYESSAKENFPDADYKDLSQRTRNRSSRIAFYDGSAETIQLTGKEIFKIETFLPMIDTLITHLKQRSDSYKEINQRFGFLSRLKTIKSDELKNSCKEFAEMYYDDINTEELKSECLHLTQYLKTVQSSENEISISELTISCERTRLKTLFLMLE